MSGSEDCVRVAAVVLGECTAGAGELAGGSAAAGVTAVAGAAAAGVTAVGGDCSGRSSTTRRAPARPGGTTSRAWNPGAETRSFDFGSIDTFP